jgi:hypothetical protein
LAFLFGGIEIFPTVAGFFLRLNERNLVPVGRFELDWGKVLIGLER